jgi:hypothetical protein
METARLSHAATIAAPLPAYNLWLFLFNNKVFYWNKPRR